MAASADARAPDQADGGCTTSDRRRLPQQEEVMPLIQVKVIENVFTLELSMASSWSPLVAR